MSRRLVPDKIILLVILYLLPLIINVALATAPTSSNNTVAVDEDQVYTFIIADFNFSDVDGNNFASVKIVTLPAKGALSINGVTLNPGDENTIVSVTDISAGGLKFTPVANENGTAYASYNFTVIDDASEESVQYTMTIDVNPTADPPTAQDNTLTLDEDNSIIITVADFNFSDIDGDSFTKVLIETTVSLGSLTDGGSPVISGQEVTYASLNAGNLVFTPDPNGNGLPYTNFTFKVFDSSGQNSVPHTMTFNVNSINDLPTSSNNTVTIDEDNSKVFATTDFPFSDVDGGLLTSIEITNLNITGSLQFNSVAVTNGQIINAADLSNLIFTPLPDDNGTAYATFDFRVNDGTDFSASPYTMTIDVNPVNDPPTIDPVTDPAPIYEDASQQTMNLTGITAGGGESPPPTVTAASSNTALIPTPAVNFDSGAGTAAVTYTPIANQNGTATITVTVDDGNSTVSESWLVTVIAVNDEPTVDPVANQTTNEDQALIVDLTGITPGGGTDEASQFLTITATSSDASIVPDGSVNYTQGNTTGSITFNPIANANGTVTITLTVTDDGGTTNPGDDDTNISTFTIDVLKINDPPVIDPITDPTAIDEDAGLQSVSLTGIDDGDPEEIQTISITALSGNTALIDVVNVNYTSPNSTATLTYTPLADAYGSALITVNINDGGLTTTETFTVQVNAVNDPPTLDLIPDPAAINEDAAQQSLALSGVGPGPNEATQNVTVTATSNQPGIIPDPSVIFSTGTWTLYYQPEPDQYGDVIITVTVTDDDSNQKSTSQSFTQTVISVNDPPTLDPIGDLAINEDAGLQTVALSGITDDGEPPKNLTVTATSSDVSIIPDPAVNYTSPNATGSIDFTPVPDAFGTVTITVRVTDKDGAFTEQSFLVSIANINDPPTMDNIPAQPDILEDSGPQTINLTGISPGPNESESLTTTAFSSDPAIIPDPSVSVTGSTGTLTYTPVANANGTVTLTVRLDDGQLITEKTVDITILTVNDVPVFDIQGNQAVSENSGLHTIPGFAYNIDDGDIEVQALSFQTTLGTPSGTLTFDTSPTVDVATGDLVYEATPNTNGNVTVTLTLKDNGGITNGGIDESSKDFVIYVTAVNEPPTFTLNGDPATVNEDAGAVTEAGYAQNIDDGDPELNQPLQFVLSKLSGDLTFAVDPTIDVTTGDLTYTPADNANGTAIINVYLQETDAGGEVSQTQQFTITVQAVNDPPVGADETIVMNEDEVYVFQQSDFTFSDIDNHAFAGIKIAGLPLKGDLQYNGSPVSLGQECPDITLLTYTPIANESGTAYTTFGFNVRDESGDLSISSYTMTIDVTPQPDNPVGASNSINTLEDQNYTFSVSDFPYSDPDNEAFGGIIIQTNVSKGSLLENSVVITTFPKTINDVTKLEFQPLAGENGTPYTSFTFDVVDAGGATSVGDGPYTMSINVGAVNDPPVGSDESVTFLEDQTYTFQVSDFTFSDPDGHAFDGVQITEVETSGSLQYNGIDVNPLDICPDVTLLTYIPPTNQNGTALATFRFKVRDNSSELNTSVNDYLMTINVTSVNDAPVFSITEDPPGINEDDGAQTIAAFVTGIDDGDVEVNQSLTFTLTHDGHPTLSFVAEPSIDLSGTLTYTPAANAYGVITVNVYLKDNGGVANGGVDQSATLQFTISVSPVNDQPALDDIGGPFIVNEDASSFDVNLTGISTGAPNEAQTLTVTAISSNTAILPNPAVNYTSPSATGTLTLTPAPNAYGTVDVTVTVSDGQSTNGSITKSFQVTVNPINDPPTLDVINDPAAILEDAGLQTVDLTGISAGPNESQTLTVIAESDNTTLIPDPDVNYTSPDAIGSLSYIPVPDRSGTAIITVTVTDDGSSNNTIQRQFTVTVDPVNDPPTLDDLPATPIALNEDAGQQTLQLTGISAGGNESQTLTLTAVSEFPDIIPNPTIGPVSNGQATLTYTPNPDKYGLVKITVIVDDNQSENNTISKDFYVDITSVNDPPTLDVISGSPFTIDEDSPTQTISLTGISAGGGETQTLSIYAASSDETIIPVPSISYTQGSNTATLSYIPEPDRSGSVTITVYVDDLSASNNLVSRTFTVQINEINDAPTLNDIIPPGDILEDAPQQTVTLSGITAGGGETQTLTVTAKSLQPAIIGDPQVNYSGNTDATLLFTPLPNAYGLVTIEVTVDDGQSVNNQTKKTFQVNIVPINDPPTIDDIASPVTLNEDAGTQTIELTGITPGPNESQTLVITATSDNTTLVPNPVIQDKTANTRDLIFTPTANTNGSAIITVTVNDQQSSNNLTTKTFTIEIIPVNDPPIFDIQPDANVTENAGPVTIDGFATNIDDGDPELTQTLTFELIVSGGLIFKTPPSLSAANGVLTFETETNSNGTADVTVRLTDDGSPPATSIEKSFKINVLAINGKPSFTLNGDPPAVNEDAGPVTVTSFAQNIDDGDPELNQSLTFQLQKISGGLTFQVAPQINASTGDLTYQSTTNSNGSALMSATLSDGGETSEPQYFTINVNALNDPPVGADESVTTLEDVAYTFKTTDFTYNDPENNAFSGIQIITLESNGDLEYNGTDVILNQICPDVTLLVFRPELNGNTPSEFSFKLRDSEGSLSDNTYKMTVNITPVDDDPTSAPAEVTTQENTTYTFNKNDFPFSDPDGDSFVGIRIYSLETRGDLEYNGTDVSVGTEITNFAQLKFIPAPYQNGNPYATFEFQVKDSKNTYSSAYTMSIVVGAVNDRPTGNNEQITILEDEIYTFKVSDFTFNDLDGDLFDGILIVSYETNGDLEYNGADITSLPTNCPDVTKLVFKPDPNENGSGYSSFDFKVKDNSSTQNISADTYTMTINVTAVNDPPVFNITNNPPTINEDAGTQTIANFASSINDGDPERNQSLTFSTPQLINSTGVLTFSSNPQIDVTGTLTYSPQANTYGTATFSVFLRDNGGTGNGGQNQSAPQNFTITVNSINDPPTIDPVPNQPAIAEDAGMQTVNLRNITAGPNESQNISITAISSNTSLIPHPTVVYQSPNTTGSLTYTPVTDQWGTATIEITVNDGESANNTTVETFLITVNSVNDPPTIDDIPNPNPIPENSSTQTVTLTGITAGGGEDQSVILSVTSSNTALIPTPTISYSGGSTAQLSYTPIADRNGNSTISVTVDDQNGGLVTKSFEVSVTPVNSPPTLDPIADPDPIAEDSGPQNVPLTGISSGTNENQPLTIFAESSNTTLISIITIDYTYPSTTGTLTFSPNSNQFGTVIISVTVDDGSAANNQITRQFKVEVTPVPDMPSVTNAITNEGEQTTGGLIIERNTNDGEEVKYFKITNIMNGTLFYGDGVTQIQDGEFIPYDQANSGLRFTPDSRLDGSFNVQASLTNHDGGLGGNITTAIIVVNSIPTTTDLPDLTLNEDSPQIVFDLYQAFDDEEDLDINLKFEVSNTAPDIVNATISGQTLTITFLKDQNGTAFITVKCTDTNGAFVEDLIELTVVPVNDPPVFISSPVLSVNQDSNYSYLAETNDVEGNVRYFELNGPSWLVLDDNGDGTANISGTPGQADVGDHLVEISVIETVSGLSTTQTYTLSVNNVNDPPAIVSDPPTTATETEKYEYLIEVADPDVNDTYMVYLDPASKLSWLVLSTQAPFVLEGFPPVGSAGSYIIKLIVIDAGGLVGEQIYTLEVKAQNIPPVVQNFPVNGLIEDQSYTFSIEEFTSAFSDADPGDELIFIKIMELPLNGSLLLNNKLVNEGDTIYRADLNKLVFKPDENYFGLNFFTWTASDGKSLALTPSRVDINILPVDDPPLIINMETSAVEYEFGDFNVFITDNAEVLEVDDGRIASAEISISGNYIFGQDSLAILDFFSGISTHWNDTIGVLSIRGLKSATIYQDVIRSCVYVNKKRFAPNTKTRTVRLVVSDGELTSEPVTRDVTFRDTFVELVIPTGFTPNNDGVNDTWEIDNIQNHEDAVVRVYTREGVLIYESVGFYKEWDGTYNGKIVKPGVYYFTIEIVKFERKFTGSLTILR